MPETKDVKALRLHRDKRVARWRDRPFGVVEYLVVGDSDAYFVTVSDDGYRCTCPARTTCSHELAVVLFAGNLNGPDVEGGDDGETT